MVKRMREVGRCELVNDRGQTLYLPRDQYHPVRTAWLKGAPFVDIVDFYGAPGTVKLEKIQGIFDCPAETILARIEEERLDEADDSLAGGTA